MYSFLCSNFNINKFFEIKIKTLLFLSDSFNNLKLSGKAKLLFIKFNNFKLGNKDKFSIANLNILLFSKFNSVKISKFFVHSSL